MWVKPRKSWCHWACGKGKAFHLEGTEWAEPWKQSQGSGSCVWGLQPWEEPGSSGPSLSQGARALASALTSNPYIKRLDLWDNGLCGPGAEALAGALSKSSSICGRC